VDHDRGIALILALLVLSFLSVLGGALLATSTIDIWIGDNYTKAMQSLYIAEAGVEHGRELLRTSSQSTSEWLAFAAGPDGQLLTADDRPLVQNSFSGGFYEVRLRNDFADRVMSLPDTNGILTLSSVGQIGLARKTIEAVVRKEGFPETPLDSRLQFVAGLERLAAGIRNNASIIYTAASMNDFAGLSAYQVGVADGKLELGPGSGYGLLLVRDELSIVGDVTWQGLIVVIGRGVITRSPGVTLTVHGGLFTGQTRAPDGSLLTEPGGVTFEITDVEQIKAANRPFPFNPISIREK
jgi:hypothetical protein